MASFAYENTADGMNPEKISAADLQNAYKRDSQVDLKVKRMGDIAAAYRDPADYYGRKAAALNDAGISAANLYREEFQKLIRARVPASTAHVRAKKIADTLAEALRVDVESDFPSDLNQLSLQLHYNTAPQNAANGFMTPSTETGTTHRKKHRHHK